ncbi:hypothetical protein DFJ73DRAFT_961957 [Zopfochytrium polystomum]|nr:hypothetical protein DFJ73DRAFT_961957 [Zopfochytrium polystomum]
MAPVAAADSVDSRMPPAATPSAAASRRGADGSSGSKKSSDATTAAAAATIDSESGPDNPRKQPQQPALLSRTAAASSLTTRAAAKGLSAFQAAVIALLALIAGILLRSADPKELLPTVSLLFRSSASQPTAATNTTTTGYSTANTPVRQASPNRKRRAGSLSPSPLRDPKAAGVASDPADAVAADESFFHAHFSTHFGISVVHTTVIDPVVLPFLIGHDIFQDEKYTDDPDTADEWRQRIGWVLDDGLPDDKRFEIKWVSKEKGYGVFAKVHIAKGSIIGIYSGVLTNASNSDYMWTYPSVVRDENGNELSLGIDAQYRGNFARFVNHDGDPNCDSVYVPYSGIWHVVYVAERPIARGEEVTVSYGSGYWENRPGMLAKGTEGKPNDEDDEAGEEKNGEDNEDDDVIDDEDDDDEEEAEEGEEKEEGGKNVGGDDGDGDGAAVMGGKEDGSEL